MWECCCSHTECRCELRTARSLWWGEVLLLNWTPCCPNLCEHKQLTDSLQKIPSFKVFCLDWFLGRRPMEGGEKRLRGANREVRGAYLISLLGHFPEHHASRRFEFAPYWKILAVPNWHLVRLIVLVILSSFVRRDFSFQGLGLLFILPLGRRKLDQKLLVSLIVYHDFFKLDKFTVRERQRKKDITLPPCCLLFCL